MDSKWDDIVWELLPYILAILTYLFGLAKNKWKMPKAVGALLSDKELMDAIRKGVEDADKLKGKTGAEKQEFVRTWVKSAIQNIPGLSFVSDSSINFLIELVLTKRRAA